MTLQRLPDWQTRLVTHLGEVKALRFDPATHHCALFVADCVEAMTGVDLAAQWRSLTLQQGLRALRKAGEGWRRLVVRGAVRTLARRWGWPWWLMWLMWRMRRLPRAARARSHLAACALRPGPAARAAGCGRSSRPCGCPRAAASCPRVPGPASGVRPEGRCRLPHHDFGCPARRRRRSRRPIPRRPQNARDWAAGEAPRGRHRGR
jgi:hypothetical protein